MGITALGTLGCEAAGWLSLERAQRLFAANGTTYQDVISLEQLKAALDAHPQVKLVGIVHAETSTGAHQPLTGFAELVHARGALLAIDAVTSLGGHELRVDDWGIDAIYSGTQKCLSCPPGLSPVSFGERALAKMDARKTKVQSWYLDVSMLRKYYTGGAGAGGGRVYHHTAPINMTYALHEALMIVLEEGLDARIERHAVMHRRLRPRHHRFKYRVFAMLLDLERVVREVECSERLNRLRRRLEELGMFFEGNARLPATLSEDTAAFEKSLLDTKAAGGTVARTVSRAPQGSSGRRYEFFKSYAEFKAWQDNANAIVLKCLPIAERVGVKLALENHKDRQVADHAEFLRKTSSEYLGSLIDPGNNMSLLETPEETVNALAPFVLATSLKDMGVAPYQDGFLLSEVVFGTGATDQAALFRIMRKVNPKVNMVEELITRDPLKIPCFTDAYWAGFPAKDQKRMDATLAWVKAKQTKLPYVDQLTVEERFKVEEDNHRKTIDWGRTFRA